MNYERVALLGMFIAMLFVRYEVLAGGPKVSALGNRHNLSAQNTGVKYFATNDLVNNPKGQQICIFCHTPHSALPQGALWNRKDTTLTFARYTSSTLDIRNIAAAQYAPGSQPNGSSRLCLSCHDGATGLGDVVWGGPIAMNINAIPAGDIMSFNPISNKMKSGHHPVSFVYAQGFNYQTQIGTMIAGLVPAVDFRLPVSVTLPGPLTNMAAYVKLQDTDRKGNGWMQCTTCHDPHQNMGNDKDVYSTPVRKVTPFWVYSTAGAASASHDAVCNACHTNGLVTPAPFP
ncbi:MAG: hypothetical protein WCP10_02010 [Desulfuromonadales bacterium]